MGERSSSAPPRRASVLHGADHRSHQLGIAPALLSPHGPGHPASLVAAFLSLFGNFVAKVSLFGFLRWMIK